MSKRKKRKRMKRKRKRRKRRNKRKKRKKRRKNMKKNTQIKTQRINFEANPVHYCPIKKVTIKIITGLMIHSDKILSFNRNHSHS
jgi:hypothetical protein